MKRAPMRLDENSGISIGSLDQMGKIRVDDQLNTAHGSFA